MRENKDTNVESIKKALLVLHSPIDTTVAISQAEKIFVAAKHPKSFVSLDNADHLLTKKPDAEYVASTITAWASRYLLDEPAPAQEKVHAGHLVVKERDKRFTQDIRTDDHQWVADEPVAVGGNNFGPDPYELLLASLGSCTAMTLRMYASRKKLAVDNIKIELDHSRDHGADCSECDEAHPQIDVISRKITIDGDLDETQRNRLIEIADKCPVHRSLHNKLVIKTEAV